MTARDRVARAWHAGSDHAVDGEPFGGPLCNCQRVAELMMPLLRAAWNEGNEFGIAKHCEAGCHDDRWSNPYETKEN